MGEKVVAHIEVDPTSIHLPDGTAAISHTDIDPGSIKPPAEPTLGQKVVNAMPAAGSVVGAVVGGVATGGLGGESVGAGAGGAAGSAAKDYLNNWLYGGKKSSADIATDAAEEGAKDAVMQGAGGALLKGVAKGVGAAAEHLVPPSVIARYREAGAAIMKLTNDTNGNIAAAATQVRNTMKGWLDDFSGKMNAQISQALKGSTERVNPEGVLSALNSAKSAIDSDLPEAAAQKDSIQQLIDTVRKKFDENGQIFASDAHDLKQWLQKQAQAAYEGKSDKVARAAQNAAAKFRVLTNEALPKGLQEANNNLAALHNIDDTINRSLLEAGKPESSLLAAGKYTPGARGGSATNYEALRKLSEITGQDFVGQARNLSAMDTLGNAKPKLSGEGVAPFALRKALDIGASPAGKLGSVLSPGLGQTFGRGAATVGQTIQDMIQPQGGP